MPDKHARLSASSSHRWLVCTPCVALEETLPDKAAGVYAAEGTLAHSVCETKLRAMLGDNHREPEHDDEMEAYANAYRDFVGEELAALRAETPDASLYVEQTLILDAYVPEGFGTADAVLMSDKTLEVIDFKYGKGVPVKAEDNPQLRLYALGAYEKFKLLYDFTEVKSVIFQPRLDSVTSETLPIEDLLEWGESYVKPRARMASEGQGKYVVGDHCRFCKAGAICRARAEEAFTIIDHEKIDPPLLSEDEIPDILDKLDTAEDWMKAIRLYAQQQAISQGKKWRGYKLVESRTQRKIADPIKAAEALKKAGLPEEDYTTTKLKGLTDLQKLLGKKKFEEVLSKYIVKPQGEPVLVPDSDKRPEINPIEEVFKEEIE